MPDTDRALGRLSAEMEGAIAGEYDKAWGTGMRVSGAFGYFRAGYLAGHVRALLAAPAPDAGTEARDAAVEAREEIKRLKARAAVVEPMLVKLGGHRPCCPIYRGKGGRCRCGWSGMDKALARVAVAHVAQPEDAAHPDARSEP